jgi:hypothetical protein
MLHLFDLAKHWPAPVRRILLAAGPMALAAAAFVAATSPDKIIWS